MRKFLLLVACAILLGSSVLSAQECKHGAKAEGTAHKCSATCPAHGREVVKTEENVTLTGTIKCNHCDLHRADKCQSVLVTEAQAIYQFCPDSVKDIGLKQYSKKQITVKGSVKRLKDADAVIHVDSLKPAA